MTMMTQANTFLSLYAAGDLDAARKIFKKYARGTLAFNDASGSKVAISFEDTTGLCMAIKDWEKVRSW